MTDFQVDPEALKQTAKGINDTIKELEAVGFAEGAGAGRGFSMLELTGLQIGEPGCKSAFDDFCERWALQVRALVQEGNQIAERLHLSAGYYHEQEEYLSNSMKVVVNSAMGNPNLTEEQIDKQSWGQTLGDNPYTQVTHADFSMKSWAQAGVHSEAAWKNAEADALRYSPEARVLGGDEADAAKAEARAKQFNEQYKAMGGGS
ncbi:hypothetical protein ABT095_31685 [Kitasatospora sp. NPDC002227]|uniref:hypothetical protein n=1 Tax=Kitasatospora sp. NPDC002227 TaxID=3154773 RepID=UPI00332B54BA